MDKTKTTKYRRMTNALIDNAKMTMNAYDEIEQAAQQLTELKSASTCVDTTMSPTFTYETLTDDEVKRRTGFSDKQLMLAFIIMVCNGDHEKLTSTVTSLT